MKAKRYSSTLLGIIRVLVLITPALAAAQIQVSSTNPIAAPQGTTNLNVTVSGSGFKKGAKAQWFISGTTNPGGVTVNSTTYNSSSQLTANITIATNATISGFDVLVTNTDGRTGKGTDLFAVTQQGTPIGCTTTGTPSGFSLQGVLNPVQSNGAALITTLTLGNAIRVRPLDLDHNGTIDTLVAFVTSGNQSGTANPGTYVFFLDPVTGLPQANNPITGAAWQNPLQVLSGIQSRHVAAGDVNGDGIPDFLLGSPDNGVAYLFVGAVSGSPLYTPSYTAYQISPPAGAPSTWARTVALGDLNADGKDEIAVAAIPGNKQKVVPAVYLYSYTGSAVAPWGPGKIQDPTGSVTSDFGGGLNGGAVAIGSITGSAGSDLAVGADSGGTSGLVYVFPYPVSQSNYFTLTGPGSGFGGGVGIADVNVDGYADLVVDSGGSSGESSVFAGVVHPGAVYTNQLLPANGVGMGQEWAWPGFDLGNLQTVGAVAVGTLSASQTNACTPGAVQLFTSPYGSSQQPNYVFEPPSLVGSGQYGYNIGLVPGYPFILISAHYDNVGTTSGAGQVFVYKKN